MCVCVNFNIIIERTFFFFFYWDGAPLGVGDLCKLRTLRIGSGGTGVWLSRDVSSWQKQRNK